MEVVSFIRDSYIEFVKMNLEYSDNIKEVPLEIDNLSYLDDRILKDIKATIPLGNMHTIKFNDVHLKITIAGVDKASTKLLIFKTCFLIYLLNKPRRTHIKNLDVTLIGYEGKKTLPTHDQGLTQFEINSGVTITGFDSSHARVIVYRKEEMIKVLTHEMIHAFGLDAKSIPVEQERVFNDYFKITCKSSTINESFTDSLACLINTVIYSYLHNRDDFEKTFIKNMKKETKHIMEQAEKVLVYNKYSITDGVLHHDTSVCEATHVTSYYVIKAIIYCDLDGFIAFLNKHRMHIHVEEYIELIKRNMPIFLKKVRLNKNKSVTRNLNMTSLDIMSLKTI